MATAPNSTFTSDEIHRAGSAETSRDAAIPASDDPNSPSPTKPSRRMVARDMTSISNTTQSTSTTSSHYVFLSWKASASSVMGYYIYRGLSSNGSFTKLNMIPNAATVYTDYSVSAGQTYYYYVTAVSTLGQSTISNVVQAIVPSP